LKSVRINKEAGIAVTLGIALRMMYECIVGRMSDGWLGQPTGSKICKTSSCSNDMSFRFQRRIKILPGLRLNVSKTGISWTVGTRGASVTARDGKLTGNVGIPGTGLSYRKRLDLPNQDQVASEESVAGSPQAARKPSWLVLAVVLGLGILIGLSIR
jgi:hypothetical protein